jgi:hypothetical protein
MFTADFLRVRLSQTTHAKNQHETGKAANRSRIAAVCKPAEKKQILHGCAPDRVKRNILTMIKTGYLLRF